MSDIIFNPELIRFNTYDSKIQLAQYTTDQYAQYPVIIPDSPFFDKEYLLSTDPKYNYRLTAYLPFGCVLAQDGDSLTALTTLLSGNKYVHKLHQAALNTTNLTLRTTSKEIEYVSITGKIFKDDELLNDEPGRCFPQYGGTQYYQKGNKVYSIVARARTKDADVSPPDSYDATEITLTTTESQLLNSITISTDQPRKISQKSTARLEIYVCLIYPNNVSEEEIKLKLGTYQQLTETVLKTAQCINYSIIDQGLAYNVNHLQHINVSAEKKEDKEYANTLDEELKYCNTIYAAHARNQAIAAKGMWAKEPWKSKIKDLAKQHVGALKTITGTAIYRFKSCELRYALENAVKYVQKVQRKYEKNDEPDEGDAIYTLLGTIVHYNMELATLEIFKEPIEKRTPEYISAIIDTYRSKAQKHWLGKDWKEEVYGISLSQWKTIRQDAVETNGNLDRTYPNYIIEMFNNLQHRPYLTEYTHAFTEVDISKFGFKSGTSIFGGFIDGMFYNEDSKKVAIMDFKTNRRYGCTVLDVRQYRLKGYNSKKPDKYDSQVLQIPYYYFALAGKQITVDGTTFTVLDNITNVDLFYDFVRYDNQFGGKDDAWKLTINNDAYDDYLKSDIQATIDDMIVKADQTSLVRAAKGTDIIAAVKEIYTPNRSTESCKYCDVRKYCTNEEIQKQNNILRPYYSRSAAKLGIVSTKSPIVIEDEDEEKLLMFLNDYITMAQGVSDKIPNLTNLFRDKYLERRRHVRQYDNANYTQIGAVYIINGSIINIQMGKDARHATFQTLRSPGPTVFRVEGTNKTATVTIRFSNRDAINSEMRHIIAQYKAFPFVSIKNSDITRTFQPFDTNINTYQKGGGIVSHLTQEYIRVKNDKFRDRPTPGKRTPADIKNEIYKNARLFYAINALSVSVIPNMVDGLDVVMDLQLFDVTTVSSDNKIAYLTDTHAVLMQMCWMYNSSSMVSPDPLYRELVKVSTETTVEVPPPGLSASKFIFALPKDWPPPEPNTVMVPAKTPEIILERSSRMTKFRSFIWHVITTASPRNVIERIAVPDHGIYVVQTKTTKYIIQRLRPDLVGGKIDNISEYTGRMLDFVVGTISHNSPTIPLNYTTEIDSIEDIVIQVPSASSKDDTIELASRGRQSVSFLCNLTLLKYNDKLAFPISLPVPHSDYSTLRKPIVRQIKSWVWKNSNVIDCNISCQTYISKQWDDPLPRQVKTSGSYPTFDVITNRITITIDNIEYKIQTQFQRTGDRIVLSSGPVDTGTSP